MEMHFLEKVEHEMLNDIIVRRMVVAERRHNVPMK
jgi:hypothetical protein